MFYWPGDPADPVVLDAGEYRGIQYVILDRHTHPCCYIACRDKETVDRYCHGGVTYSGKCVPGLEDGTMGTCWLGWDYCHAFDRTATRRFGKSWTTEELVKEVHEVIDKVLGDG